VRLLVAARLLGNDMHQFENWAISVLEFH